MPFVNVKITRDGVTAAQKAQVVAEITATLQRVLGKRPEHTHIVIDEVDPENWGFSGVLTTEYRRSQSPGSGSSMVEGARPAAAMEVVRAWVDAFNRADAEALAELYADGAVNHQVMLEPVVGRDAIRAMFRREFASVRMVCLIEHLHHAGEWAILEWRDPKGLRGCGFFQIIDGKIHAQRGYWDRLTFLRQQDLPIPTT